MKLIFIGGGNMATALIGGLLKNGWPPAELGAVEIDAAARERLAHEFGIACHADVATGVAAAECVVLAVKPQHLRAVAATLAPHVAGRLIVTIAAGIRCADLARWLGGHARIVRAMPNTPALVLAGMTGLYAAAGATTEDRAAAQRILGAAGATLWLEREEQLDAVTAVSGSGPAYVFYFIEAVQRAAAELGFAPEAARQLALETFSGAVKLALGSTEDAATLRARVTSKGGTTERALAEMDAQQVSAAIVRAIHAASARSRELGDELGRD